MKIAILVPVCSRNQTYRRLEDTPFFKIFYPHFTRTKESCHTYRIFLGMDDDDAFYLQHVDALKQVEDVDVSILSKCQHYPTKAWNVLFEKAVKEDFDYFLQVGDDVGLQTEGWTSRFISCLQKQDNIGTVGPCEPGNYNGRKRLGKPIVNENNFVHRTHYDIFGFFFFPDIKNWYCDDWITFVYGDYAHMDTHVLCTNEIKGDRYHITDCPFINLYVGMGKTTLERYLKQRNLKNTTADIQNEITNDT